MLTTIPLIRHTGWSILFLAALAFSGSAFALAGKFQFVNGDVSVVSASGQGHAVKKGDAINAGDSVVTTAGGFAQIRMEDGGIVSVRPDTSFKVDAFEFDGKDDASGKSFFSLVKGSLRSVTGLIGKLHHENYRITTANATIGIRGSGADVGYGDSVGTAIHTLFGAHTISSTLNGNTYTLNTSPGQTALVAPGGVPQYVLTFPFSTTNTPPGGKGGNGNGSGQPSPRDSSTVDNTLTNTTTAPTTTTGGTSSTTVDLTPPPVIPITSTSGFNFTTPTVAFALPAGGFWGSGNDTVVAFSGGGFVDLNTGGDDGFQNIGSSLVFDAAGNLTGRNQAGMTLSMDPVVVQTTDCNSCVNDTVATLDGYTISGGTPTDRYAAPDGSIYFGRWQGGTLSLTNCQIIGGGSCSENIPIVDSLWIVGQLPAPAFVNTLTGTMSYTKVAATTPFDAMGNLGVLNSAYINANFTKQTASFGVNLTVAGATLDAAASCIPIVKLSADAETGGRINRQLYRCQLRFS